MLETADYLKCNIEFESKKTTYRLPYFYFRPLLEIGKNLTIMGNTPDEIVRNTIQFEVINKYDIKVFSNRNLQITGAIFNFILEYAEQSQQSIMTF